MLNEKENFIKFIIESEVLKFGNFLTKSGRKSPYFINIGNCKTGKQLYTLSLFYSNLLKNSGVNFNAIFGPAYKGIPLVVSCCITFLEKYGINLPILFNRKEEKDHGENGNFIGHIPEVGEEIAVVEDVLTAGTALTDIIPKLKQNFNVKIQHVFIAVNRCEKVRNSNESAEVMLKRQFNIEVHSLVDIYDIRNFLKNNDLKYKKYLKDMDEYVLKYCVKKK